MNRALLVLAFACRTTDPIVHAVTHDPPADAKFPLAMEPVQIPSGDVRMNGIVYLAGGPGPHPTVVLLHGFPGNEQSLDLAQAMRRVGWNVLAFHYRGSWGSPGAFSFTHAVEDGRAAVAFVRANAAKLRADASRIAVVGHSMGGFIAARVAMDDPAVIAAALIAAWNINDDAVTWAKADAAKLVAEANMVRPDTIPLAGTSAEDLIQEAIAHGAEWDYVRHAGELGTRAVLVISTNDGGQPGNHAFAEAARKTARVTEVHLPTDHSLSDHRIALGITVGRWLETLR